MEIVMIVLERIEQGIKIDIYCKNVDQNVPSDQTRSYLYILCLFLTQQLKYKMTQNLCSRACCLGSQTPQELKIITEQCKCPDCLISESKYQMEEQQAEPYPSNLPLQASSQVTIAKYPPFNIVRDYRETAIDQQQNQHVDHTTSSSIILDNWKKSRKMPKTKKNTKNIKKGPTKPIRKPRNKFNREDDKNSCRSVNRGLIEIIKRHFQQSCRPIITYNKHNNKQLRNKATLVVFIEKRLNSAEKLRLQKILISEAHNLRNHDSNLFKKTISKLEGMIKILSGDYANSQKLLILENAGNDREGYGRFKIEDIAIFDAKLNEYSNEPSHQ